MVRQRIYSVIPNKLNDEDRLAICNLLVKAGYTVKIDKERKENKGAYTYYIEYWEDKP